LDRNDHVFYDDHCGRMSNGIDRTRCAAGGVPPARSKGEVIAMAKPLIAVINESTVVDDATAATWTPALQQQVTNDFFPIWGTDATLVFVPKGQSKPAGSWWLTLLDDSDQADALGYHDVTDQDLPLGKVFCKTTQADGGVVSVTASHELIEMLGDPHINLSAAITDQSGHTDVYAYEACDACEADQFGYTKGSVLVSDFVTPAWFDPASPAGTQFDFQNKVTKALQLLSGGYIGKLSTSDQWTQVTADRGVHHSSLPRYRGNRWHRRAKGRYHFQRSRPTR
jgi:hypothetical protein